MKSYESLQKRRQKLREEILENLDFLMGSVSTKGPSRSGLNLTFKIDQVTRTRHIRRELEPQVKQMTLRCKRVRRAMHELSDLNWQLLCRGML